MIVREDDASALSRAAAVVRNGGILVYPTSTVYGIGGDAASRTVTDRVHEIKGSSADKPLLLLTDDWSLVAEWIRPPSSLEEGLMRVGRLRPITILFEASASAPKHLVGPSGKVGMRLTRHDFCRSLIRLSGSPIVSTSANHTGQPPPVRFSDVPPDILDETDLAIEGGPGSGLASTIVTVDNGSLVLVRLGSVGHEEILNLTNETDL